MCSQNAANVISEPLILRIFRATCPPDPPPQGITKYDHEPPPRQNQNSTPMQGRQMHREIKINLKV